MSHLGKAGDLVWLCGYLASPSAIRPNFQYLLHYYWKFRIPEPVINELPGLPRSPQNHIRRVHPMPTYNKCMPALKEYFLLDPNVVFLNHGSFGAIPKPVFEAYQNWQLRLERQPVLLLARELSGLLRESRTVLGAYVHAEADDLVYIPNATHGV